mgnify:CR=1 FL=1
MLMPALCFKYNISRPWTNMFTATFSRGGLVFMKGPTENDDSATRTRFILTGGGERRRFLPETTSSSSSSSSDDSEEEEDDSEEEEDDSEEEEEGIAADERANKFLSTEGFVRTIQLDTRAAGSTHFSDILPRLMESGLPQP